MYLFIFTQMKSVTVWQRQSILFDSFTTVIFQSGAANKWNPCSELNLVDPKNHGVLQVEGQLLRGAEGGEALDGVHYFLDADHLHRVGHHQMINHMHVCTLCWGGKIRKSLQCSFHSCTLTFWPVECDPILK